MTNRRDTAELTPSLDSDSIRLVSKLFLTNNALYIGVSGAVSSAGSSACFTLLFMYTAVLCSYESPQNLSNNAL